MIVVHGMELSFELLQIDITSKCNLNCRFCTDAAFLNRSSFLSFSDVCLALERAKELGVSQITINGGEPFLHPQIEDILREAKERGFVVCVTSNGTLLSSQLVRAVGKYIDYIQLSIDGTNAADHDFARGKPGAFSAVERAMEVLGKQGIKFTIRSTCLPGTLSKMDELVEYAIKHNASSISLNPVIPTAATHREDLLDLQQMELFFTKLQELIERHHDSIRISTAMPIKNALQPWKEVSSELLDDPTFFSGCSAGICALFLNSSGELWPCAHLPIKICNLYDDWKVAFESSEIVDSLVARAVKGKCASCRYKQSCGGCRGYAFGLTGDYLAEQPNCPLWREKLHEEASL